MADIKLKRLGRFELLELVYDMRKANLDLIQRLEEAEARADKIQQEADARIEEFRTDYEQRIEELRMKGASADLQKRMKTIEEQLKYFQQLAAQTQPDALENAPAPAPGESGE